MQLGSKEHFQNIFSRIEIDQNENPDLKIEQLLNEIDQLKHYHKLEIENMTESFNLVNDELKKARSHIEWLDSKMEILND
mgnify:CR=1 FL=1|tara:strand:- start:33 stop:272 length:240 start_codon:yes stop_codon:yes gene_type:complete